MAAYAALEGRQIFDPPMRRTRMENHPTLLVSWWCTGCAFVLILIRLWGRCVRTEKLFLEDKIMALSVIPLWARMALIDPVMLWGTNNVETDGLTPAGIEHREMGSKLVLASRIFYALFIWMAKFTVSEYLRRLTSTFWTRAHQRVLLGIRVFLVATFFAVVIATLGECQPFDHYWQVVPDPGPDCRSGYAQLFVMSVCDIITDILLILFPISIIARSAMPFRRKLSICVLFALSIILIVITAYRVSAIVLSGGRQQLRTLWASLEILAAAAVSNALILGSFVRDRGVKKSKYKAPAGAITTDATVEPQSNLVRKMTARHWGNDSDENLFASVRGRLDSVCTADASMIPAPLSAGLSVGSRPFSPRYRDDIPSISEVDGLVEPEEASEAVELMDVGGILSDDPKESTSTSVRKVSDDSRAPPGSAPWIASSSRDFVDSPTTDTKFDFADVGGLLSPRAERPAAALSVTSAPRQLAAPGHTFSSMAPVRAPPLRKNPSTLSRTSDMSLAPRRSSVASSQMTDESNGDSQAIALDMLAKIKAARAERTRQTLQRNDSYNMAGGGQGRLFGESGPSVGLFQPPQPD